MGNCDGRSGVWMQGGGAGVDPTAMRLPAEPFPQQHGQMSSTGESADCFMTAERSGQPSLYQGGGW